MFREEEQLCRGLSGCKRNEAYREIMAEEQEWGEIEIDEIWYNRLLFCACLETKKR